MNNINLETEDFKQIEAILRNNKNLDRLYTKLYNLDIEEKKDTEEYKKLLDYISIVIEVENKIYKESNLTLEKALNWAKLFLNMSKKNIYSSREELLKQNYDNRIVLRILNHLLTIISKNHYELINLPMKELTNITTILGIKISKTDKKILQCKCITMKNIIDNDINYAFLSFLEEHIENPKEKTYKENLLNAKYNLSFTNKNIETYLLTNNFKIQKNTYISSELISELLQINKELYKRVKDSVGYSIVNTQIYELLELSDMDYSSKDKVSSSILRQCMMDSAFLFMSDEKISDSNYDFHEYIETEEYNEIQPNHNISSNIIINSFTSIKNNKEKVHTLKLK